MGASKQAIDFTNVKEGGNFSKKHMPVGDYRAKITKVEDAMPKDKEDKTAMWLFTMQLVSTPSATYPYYCKLQENQLWKVRNLLVAAGLNVPKKKIGVDPNRLVNKIVAVSLDDTEYNGKEQSEIGAVFSPNELDDSVEDTEPDDVDDVDPEDDDEETPPPAKRKAKPAPVEEDEDEEDVPEVADDEDEEDEDQFSAMDRSQLKRAIKKATPGFSVKKSMTDDDLRALLRAPTDEDDEEEDEAPAPKKKKAAPVDEDEDELDIEDL